MSYLALAIEKFFPSTSVANNNIPVFSGISGLSQNADGSLTASYSAATGSAATPITYYVYVQAGTATGLFNSSNLVRQGQSLSQRIFIDASGNILQVGQTYYVGIRAVSSNNITDTNTASLSAAITNINYNTLAASVWDILTSTHTATGSFGKFLQDQLNATVGSRLASASYTAPDNTSISAIKAKTDNLPASPANEVTSAAIKAKTDNLPSDPASNTQVNTRASQASVSAIPTNPLLTTDTRLNNLDASISSRLPTSSYVAPDNASVSAIKVKTDNLPSDPASNTQVNTRASQISVNAIPTNPLLTTDARLNNLDTTISSRLPTSSYVAPDNASIASIKAQTDKFLFDGSSYVRAHTMTNDDKSAYALTASQISAITGGVWEELIANHTVVGTFGAVTQNPSLSPTQIAQAVWNAATSSYNQAGSFGANAQNPQISPTQIANAVWDALVVNHVVTGSFGVVLSGGGNAPILVKTSMIAKANQASIQSKSGPQASMTTKNIKTIP